MTETTTPQPKKERVKLPKFGVQLRGPAGDVMKISAKTGKSGNVATFVTVVSKLPDGTKSKVRGASESHANMDAAKVRIETLRVQATKVGWAQGKVSGGGSPKKDAFDFNSLPAPKK